MIDVLSLVEVIINIVVCYYNISKSIIIDQDLLLISKFWF